MSITIISKHLQLICCLLFFLYFTFSFSVCDKQCCSLFVTCQSGDLFLFFFFSSHCCHLVKLRLNCSA